MDESAPKEVLQHVDQQTADLQKNVAAQSTQAGHPTTAADVNPQDSKPLEAIREALGEAVHFGADVVAEAATGKDRESDIRVISTEDAGRLRLGRLSRLLPFGSKSKAA